MSQEAAIIESLQVAWAKAGPRPDPRQGAAYQQGLSRALGARVEDRTDYTRGRVYIFEQTYFDAASERFRTVLRIRISSAGPFAVQGFVLESNEGFWWSGPVRVDRGIALSEHTDRLARLRNWYRESGLTEVEQQVQGALLPEHIPYPRPRGREVTLYQALFKD